MDFQKQLRESIKTYDQVIDTFGKEDALPLKTQVVIALVNKGNALTQIGQNEKAIEAYNKVIDTFGKEEALPLKTQVAIALVNKGNALTQIGQNEKAIENYDKVINTFGKEEALPLKMQVAIALFNKGNALTQIGQNEKIPEINKKTTRITPEITKHIAKLARIELFPEEIEPTRHILNNILGLFDQLAEVDTDHIPPMVSTEIESLRMREDVVTEENLRESLLASAPQTFESFYTVPRVVE